MNVLSKDISGESPKAGDHQKREVDSQPSKNKSKPQVVEKGGPAGLEPTRYGDWERNGIARDF
jgi:hypothetical protein